ncbi:Superoxide dismutase Mn 1 [Porphyridium purpureum]|uniref:superoxide dismutase n=1 Tax=Porphyridium purpureum TaxID=35688 RepID=A0A5J4YX52_PORPP|nr:Superoxide dismutase Mn 1 [Porphyridium purpureum]|eukprot:POR9610..scf209_3
MAATSPSTGRGIPSRRDFLGLAAWSAAALAMPKKASAAESAVEAPPVLPLPPLPYSYTALEPVIDEETMKLHHDKHFATYTKTLNAALAQLAVTQRDLLPKDLSTTNAVTVAALVSSLKQIKDEKVRSTIRNHGGGYLNHLLYFSTLRPMREKNAPKAGSKIEAALISSFGSVEAFKQELIDKSMSQFGSGWGWLYYDGSAQKLKVSNTPNQDTPVMESVNNICLFGIDVWEHAYYLRRKNDRGAYVKAIFDLVDWDTVEAMYTAHV